VSVVIERITLRYFHILFVSPVTVSDLSVNDSINSAVHGECKYSTVTELGDVAGAPRSTVVLRLAGLI